MSAKGSVGKKEGVRFVVPLDSCSLESAINIVFFCEFGSEWHSFG